MNRGRQGRPARPRPAEVPNQALDARSGVPRAGAFAFREASLRHVELVALYVTEEIPGSALDTVDPFAYDPGAAVGAADRMLAEALAGHGDAYPDVAVRRHMWHDPALVRALAAQAENAALLVVAARDHPEMSERMLGTVTAGRLEARPCPLAIVPARGPSKQGIEDQPTVYSPVRTGEGELAILVYFEQVRDDDREVEYKFGFPTLDRRLVIRKDTLEVTPADGELDKAGRTVFAKIAWLREKEGRWPTRGGHQA